MKLARRIDRLIHDPVLACGLEQAIRRRSSVRSYSGDPLTLGELARLLGLAYGVTHTERIGSEIGNLRAVPSGGGLYPLEFYVVAARVEGLQPGVYHYNVPDHAMEVMPAPPDLASRLHGVSHYAETVTGAAALIVMTAVFQRSIYKYGDRGYRFILLEAGHAAQNVLLTATALDLGAVAVGGFRDNLLSDLVEADGMDEAALSMLAVGRPGPAPG